MTNIFSHLRVILLTCMLALLFISPAIINAAEGDGAGVGEGAGAGIGEGAGPPPSGCKGNTLCNPLNSESITEFLVKILDILLTLALPLIVLYIMYGGYLLVTAQGEPGALQKGRAAIMWSVIGGVIVLASKLILNIIEETVKAL